MSVIGDARIDLLQAALDGLAQRQQVIAGNIANVDTPGYQRRDVDFESALRAYLSQQGGVTGASLADVPSSSLLETSAGAAPGRSGTTRNDGNNVDIDYEMTELSETQLRYELLAQATTSRFSELQDIIGKSS